MNRISDSIDVFVRKQGRANNMLAFYVFGAFFLLTATGLGLLYANIFALNAAVNGGLPLYYTTYTLLLIHAQLALRRIPALADVLLLRRRLRTDAVVFAALAIAMVPLHMRIINDYAAFGVPVPTHMLLIESVVYIVLLLLSALHLRSVYKSDKWPRPDGAVIDSEAGGGE